MSDHSAKYQSGTDEQERTQRSQPVTFTSHTRNTSLPFDTSLLPNGSRSLSSIGTQAFALGNVFTGCIIFTIGLVASGSAWWRLPSFFVFLSLFHFLEYYTTARYNVPAARSSSFLLFSNGSAYTIAHALATAEIVISNALPKYQSFLVHPTVIAVGIVLVIVGQLARSVAMAQAGTNFNHIVAREHKDSHVLVKSGLYAYVRHPSYFGFFWWALGTQLVVGNKICLVAYAIVLWRFFYRRIKAEENYLVKFFDKEYELYRKQTPTYIPFVS